MPQFDKLHPGTRVLAYGFGRTPDEVWSGRVARFNGDGTVAVCLDAPSDRQLPGPNVLANLRFYAQEPETILDPTKDRYCIAIERPTDEMDRDSRLQRIESLTASALDANDALEKRVAALELQVKKLAAPPKKTPTGKSRDKSQAKADDKPPKGSHA